VLFRDIIINKTSSSSSSTSSSSPQHQKKKKKKDKEKEKITSYFIAINSNDVCLTRVLGRHEKNLMITGRLVD